MLPVEIRMKIWLMAAKRNGTVVLCKNWWTVNRIPFTPGVPLAEILEAFLRVNIISFQNAKQFKHFEGFLMKYELHDYVRALSFSSLHCYEPGVNRTQVCFGSNNDRKQVERLATLCRNFTKLQIEVESRTICQWKGTGGDAEIKVLSFLRGLNVAKL